MSSEELISPPCKNSLIHNLEPAPRNNPFPCQEAAAPTYKPASSYEGRWEESTDERKTGQPWIKGLEAPFDHAEVLFILGGHLPFLYHPLTAKRESLKEIKLVAEVGNDFCCSIPVRGALEASKHFFVGSMSTDYSRPTQEVLPLVVRLSVSTKQSSPCFEVSPSYLCLEPHRQDSLSLRFYPKEAGTFQGTFILEYLGIFMKIAIKGEAKETRRRERDFGKQVLNY